MTWTYTGDPSASLKDEVRFLIGDTVSVDPLASDEEIAYALANEATAIAAAIRVARAIAAAFSRKANMSVGDLSFDYAGRATNYLGLVAQLEVQMASYTPALPYAGGISVSDKQSQELDTDRVEPAFKKGMHDFQHSTDNPLRRSDN